MNMEEKEEVENIQEEQIQSVEDPNNQPKFEFSKAGLVLIGVIVALMIICTIVIICLQNQGAGK